ncbi:acetyl-CoA hydrolase/transferase family protein [Oleiharenicola lentus]|jgi:acyl-CoA hydrolase|uniref:Acetyl-CoA hydrolase/transferase family protein n=1 Tax=Oleiharenicola lentus TaxID=2508720 RepID=A0A4Q1C425_9BACT|nr:acetyl-CoA hydrolase/transferase C-terminal domain-containing protein [Oleiharenicola lentus]RXK53154.1 acetyl-CoA hydrolase/transferase family protein [Oleiharenicola lentus]
MPPTPSPWFSRAVSAADAVAPIRSGANIFIHGAAATPTPLVEALAARRDLEGVRLWHLHTNGPAPFAEPGREKEFRSISLFTGAPLRAAVKEGRADFVPIFLSDIPDLFLSGQVKLDVALLQLSPPDRNGLCSLGTSCDAAKAAFETAKLIIAEINERMPRTHGNNVVPFSRVDAFIATNRPLHGHHVEAESPVEARIGEIIADLVEDGSTLQMGIGGIPDAALSRMKGKRDLGIHTEMFSDRIVDLVEAGAVTNRFKEVGQGRILTSFINGSQRLFDFVHDNPLVHFYPCDWTNDTSVIRKNPKVVAINSAIQIDLTGQVCADSIGDRIYSGIGGQMDFIRGAALSPGGKPIIALPALAMGGKVSRIAPQLAPGAGVVTTRGHVHWVITEYGAVNLHGRTLRERGEALISIAHPDFRAELRRDLNERRHFTLA